MRYLPSYRSEGNLTYLQFIGLVKYLWEQYAPEIPIVPAQGPQHAKYPVITYGLDIRTPERTEPKPRYREEFTETGVEAFIVTAQRFRNIVRFTSIDKNPKNAEAVIESFEDFMSQTTPIFRQLGAADLFYSRRYMDNDGVQQPGEDAATRAVAYELVTEKIYITKQARIEEIIVDARLFLNTNNWDVDLDHYDSATPINVNIVDLESGDPA